MREIKFRAWDTERQKMVDDPYFFEVYHYSDEQRINRKSHRYYEDWQDLEDGRGYLCEIMQFTGLCDKNGKEIYEGDIVKVRKPYRTEQTHRGRNIPNGSYTEPLDPAISEKFEEVSFNNGCFIIGDPAQGNLLCWELISWDESGAMDGFRSDARCWSGPEGDLQYLLDEYEFKNEQEMVGSLGVEVAGNIYENKELITPN